MGKNSGDACGVKRVFFPRSLYISSLPVAWVPIISPTSSLHANQNFLNMEESRSRFEPIATSRAASPRRSNTNRSRSNSRSLRRGHSRTGSLHRVYSSRAFDDHTVYSPPHSPIPSHHGDSDSDSRRSSSDGTLKEQKESGLEKQETGELREPELEWRAGVVDERDFSEKTPDEIEKIKSKREDPNLVTWDGPGKSF